MQTTTAHRDFAAGAGSAQAPVTAPGLGSVSSPARTVEAEETAEAAGAVEATEAEAVDAADANAANTGALSDDNSSTYGEDDAQSFIQPTISPVATRLSSPKTPAIERARAMDERVASSSSYPGVSPPSPAGPAGPAGVPRPLGSPSAKPPPAAMSSVVPSGRFGHGRSSSVSSDAFKRFSKALPSISFLHPSTFLPTLTSSSLFSSLSSSSGTPSSAPLATPAQRPPPTSRPSTSFLQPPSQTMPASAAASARRPYVLHRANSDDSVLYHTLSRTSSLGDTDDFRHVHEQVNSRVKAIMDSFDRPTFKLPQLPLFSDGKTSPTRAAPQDPLDAALELLTGDVVILGGYRGSILRSAEPPHRQLWVPVKVGLNIRKVNMEVGLDPEDEETMRERIFPSGMLKHIGPVDISRRLFRRLRESENARQGKLRVHDYGYDWRLSPHRLSRELIAFLEKLPSNDPRQTPAAANRGAIVIAHSLGGLITRHAVNQRPDLFSGVIFAGTPQRCVNILGPLRNGDAVLLNEKVLTAQVNFSLRTTFVFLPEDGFCFVNAKNPEEEYRVDFYNVDDWLRYRWSPCIGPPALPPADQGLASSVLRRNSTIGALLEDLSGSLPSLPLRVRNNNNNNNSNSNNNNVPPQTASPADSSGTPPDSAAAAKALAPQMDTPASSLSPSPSPAPALAPSSSSLPSPSPATSPAVAAAAVDQQRARALAYLKRTLSETRQFRAELAHRPDHTAANAYPPLAVIYGRGIPTVYAARVASREAIACADAYDNLLFRSGDGVVLAREAQLPEGYACVRNGCVSSDRGHVSMLGDLAAVGRALEALVRGRAKGIGLGLGGESEPVRRRKTLPPGSVATGAAAAAAAV